jgi:hypothetical protein
MAILCMTPLTAVTSIEIFESKKIKDHACTNGNALLKFEKSWVLRAYGKLNYKMFFE